MVRKVHTPGEQPQTDEAQESDLTLEDATAGEANGSSELGAIVARIEALERENAMLRAAAANAAAPMPTNIYEPETQHGREAKANSKHLHMTSAQLTAAIADGTIAEPAGHVLCRDGYYVPRNR